jgi:hypothetical protein
VATGSSDDETPATREVGGEPAAAGPEAVPEEPATPAPDPSAAGFFGEEPALSDVAPSPREAAQAALGSLDDEDLPPRRPGRGRLVVVLMSIALLAIAALVLAGRSNAGRYRVTCGPSQLVAERGRSFPPWGYRPMSGAAWAPIGIPLAGECVARRTERLAELETWYLAAIGDQVAARLTPGEHGVATEDIDAAAALVDQGLLLSRAPGRKDDRAELERMLGDVGYWRARARVEQAAAALDEAARGFAEAAGRKPRRATDATDWAERAHRAAAALRGGTAVDVAVDVGAAPAPSAPTVLGPPAPAGTALPVEAPAPEATPAAPPAPPSEAGGVQQ